MKIRHTVIFTFYEDTSRKQIDDLIDRLNEMGKWLVDNVGVTNWKVSKHIPETFKEGRAHLLQDCVFHDKESLSAHANSEAHKRVIELSPKICDWMTVDTEVK